MTETKLALIRRVISGEVPFPPAGMSLGLTMIEADEGTTVIEMPFDERYTNTAGGVQGGILAALADAGMGTALATVCAVDESHATLEFKVNFLRPAGKDSGPLTSRARVLYRGRRVAHTEAEILSGDGRLVAKATASWLIRKAPQLDRE